jgi:hypothetical protein
MRLGWIPSSKIAAIPAGRLQRVFGGSAGVGSSGEVPTVMGILGKSGIEYPHLAQEFC